MFIKVIMYGGEDEIRTHATVARPNAFRVRPLEPLGYFSINYANQDSNENEGKYFAIASNMSF